MSGADGRPGCVKVRGLNVQAGQLKIPVSGTLGVLIRLVDMRQLVLGEADGLLRRMITAGHRCPVASPRDLPS